MYTSGSTGRPRASSSRTARVVGTFLGQEFVTFGPGEVVLQCAPVSFDAFALELFGGRCCSAACCVLQPGQSPDRRSSPTSSPSTAVTTLHVSASLLNVLVDEYPQVFRQAPPGADRRRGGVRAAPRRRLARLSPGLRVVNGYGPAETTIVHGQPPGHGRRRDRAVDPDRQPDRQQAGVRARRACGRCPVGVAGELYIGRRRRWPAATSGRPGLTAERFVADPFGDPASGCTAPATWCAGARTGMLEFLGRADDQVKIRGFRVEPGEIEAVLGRHPARRPGRGDRARGPPRRQAAGRLPRRRRGQGARPAADLRQTVAASGCPSYMVPTAFVVLDALPLTAQRQARPQGAARAGVHRVRDRAGAPQPRARRSSASSSPSPRRARRRHRRRLLRPRRPLAAGHPAGQPGTRGARGRAADRDRVRGADGRRARRALDDADKARPGAAGRGRARTATS